MAEDASRASLINNEALQSLRNEMRLQTSLDQPLWVSVHSHHYFDLEKKVWRELDAVAIRWWRGIINRREVIIKVALIVESKSLAQKHVLLPAFKPLRQAIIFDWLGGMAHADERRKILLDAGLDSRTAYQLDSEISAGASDVMPNAPNIMYPAKEDTWHAAAFVEAPNKGKPPDERLESSTIWKARLALQSAARALAHQEVEQSGREVAMAARLALVGQLGAAGKPFDLKKAFTSYMDTRPFTLTLFHPIVVVDADLWGVTQEAMVPVKHARIHLTGVSRFPYFWFDLVQRDSAEDVIAQAQANYDKQAAAKGLTDYSPQMGIAEYEIARP